MINEILQKHRCLILLIPTMLCALLLTQLLAKDRQISQTADEATHLYAGYRALKCGDFGFSADHPPLAKMVAATPLLRMKATVSCEIVAPEYEAAAGIEWLYAQNWEEVLSRARAAVCVFAVGLCIMVWIVARRMFGLSTALIASTLLVFEPNILANGALVTTDAPLTFALLFAVYSFYLWIKSNAHPYLLLAGLATGLTLVAKISGIIVIPTICLLAVAEASLHSDKKQSWLRTAGRNLSAMGFVFIIALGVMWAVYGMRFTAYPGGDSSLAIPPAGHGPPFANAIRTLKTIHLLPEGYLDGLGRAALMVSGGSATFMLGKVYPREQWFFFPLRMVIQCTTAFLVLITLAAFAIKSIVKQHRRELLFMVIPAAVFLAICMCVRMNLGLRHGLPVIPFLLIVVSAGCVELGRRVRWVRVVVPCLIVLHAASSLNAFPNYLSYANELWGGPGDLYKHLTPDYGESYKQARKFLEKHPASPCWIVTDYRMDPRDYKIPCQPVGGWGWFPDQVPTRMVGTVLVSAELISGIEALPGGKVAEFARIVPKARIAGSAMLVYEGNFDTRALASAAEENLAAKAFSAGQGDVFLQHANRAVALGPKSVSAHIVLCQALVANGVVDLALRECGNTRAMVVNDPLREQELRMVDELLQIIGPTYRPTNGQQDGIGPRP